MRRSLWPRLRSFQTRPTDYGVSEDGDDIWHTATDKIEQKCRCNKRFMRKKDDTNQQTGRGTGGSELVRSAPGLQHNLCMPTGCIVPGQLAVSLIGAFPPLPADADAYVCMHAAAHPSIIGDKDAQPALHRTAAPPMSFADRSNATDSL